MLESGAGGSAVGSVADSRIGGSAVGGAADSRVGEMEGSGPIRHIISQFGDSRLFSPEYRKWDKMAVS